MGMQLEVIRKDGRVEVYLETAQLSVTSWAKVLDVSRTTAHEALEDVGVIFPDNPLPNPAGGFHPVLSSVSLFPQLIARWQKMRREYIESRDTPNEYHPTARFHWTDKIDTSDSFETADNDRGTRFRWSSVTTAENQSN